MPLVLAAYLAFAAGLLLGFGGEVVSGVAAAVVLTAFGVWRRDLAWWGLALLGLAAIVLARSARAADEACAARVLAAPRLVARLSREATAGSYAPGRALGRGCSVPVGVAVRRGRAAAGDLVRVVGSASRSDRRVLVQQAEVTVIGGPDPLARLRGAVRRTIDRVFGADAGLARALLIADAGTLEPEVRTRYADAGIIHMLSVSGLHVAIIAGAVELLLLAMRVSRRPASLGAMLITAAYVAMIGFPAPAVRSAAMLGVGAVSRLLQRPTSPWAGFAIGASLPLADPRLILDLGYQLSVAGIAGLIASGALARRLLAGRVSGWRRTVSRDLLASAVASVVTLPLIAWTFGRVSLIAPVANLAAAPLFALLQPVLFLALLLAPLRVASAFVADVAHLLLVAVDRVAAVSAGLPFASIGVAPTMLEACLLAGAAVALVVACVSRDPARPAAAALLSLAVALWLGPRALGGGALELHMLDVGQGDAIALRTPLGRWVIVDAGRVWSSGDAGRATVVPYIRRRGGDVAAFVLSHPHADHVGGAATVMRTLRPAEFWDGAYVTGSAVYRRALVDASAAGVRWRRVHPGDSMRVDGVVITYLAPDSAWARTLDDPNEASTVALVRFGHVRFLLVGDAERLEETWLLAHARASLRADVLKVGHHGSSTSSSSSFLDAVQPSVALISVGSMNTYGHPNAEVVRELVRRGTLVMRTDHSGTVIVRTDGRGLEVGTEGGAWESPRGSVRR